jgi:hypothetical protein
MSEAVKLTKPESWDLWYRNIVLYAKKTKVWAYVDPDSEKEAPELPPQPDAHDSDGV